MFTLSKLKKHPSNPRFIRDENFKKLVESIRKMPQLLALRPIIYDPETMHIIAGWQRWEALKALDYKKVDEAWVRPATDFTPEERREILVKDNTHYGEWDEDTLANEWDDDPLEDWGLHIAGKPANKLLDIDDDDNTPSDTKPKSPTDDDYVVFEQVMQKENKVRLMDTLNKIRKDEDLEKLEDALMVLVNSYYENEPEP